MLGGIQFDNTSTAPLYRQLFEQIRGRIEAGALVPGDRIPPTRELAGQLGLNRTTVSAAYELLEKDGWIRGHVGRGSFVQLPMRGRPATSSPDTPGEPRISFLSSRPSQELFPREEFQATVAEVTGAAGLDSILQLGSPAGYEPLRAHLMERVAIVKSSEVLVTSGCQQALDLIQRSLVDAGDAVAIEDPVYPGLREAFRRGGTRVIGYGSVGELESILRRDRPRLAVVTPSFQNPVGRTLGLSERQDVVRMAAQNGTLLVEVDIYSGLRYEGDPLPTLEELAEPGAVVRVGSYSKVAFPGLRVGWVFGARETIAKMAEAKRWADLHTDHLSQAILLRFEQSGRLEAHRRRVVASGRERLAALMAALDASMPAEVSWSRPLGGMCVWVCLAGRADAAELARRAGRESVGFLPGSYFSVQRPHSDCLRLSFMGAEPAAAREGVEILSRLLREELARPASGAGGGMAAVVV